MNKIENTLTVECLLQAMDEYAEAKAERDTARDNYLATGGYSWGYYGQSYEDRVALKAGQVKLRLRLTVKELVGEALAEVGISTVEKPTGRE